MKVSEKIIELRKAYGMTQEELAHICNVSRQSVSKWEAGIMLPETEKLLLLGEIFHVSMDALLKEELVVNSIREESGCGNNTIHEKKKGIYEGILIKESVEDETIFDILHIHKIELWNTGGKPKYWTACFFTCEKEDFPKQAAKAIKTGEDNDEKWFVDFKAGNEKYVVFRDKILKYQIGNQQEKAYVCEECRKQGIEEAHMNWPE